MMVESLVILFTVFCRRSQGLTTTATTNSYQRLSLSRRWLSAQSSSDVLETIQNGISRLRTLQTLLTKYGAPGSQGCTARNDLVPVVTVPPSDLPELVSTMDVVVDRNVRRSSSSLAELLNLHPHLFPVAKSVQSGNYICGLRRAYANDASYTSSSNAPWPIVEATVGGPGMRLLALQSEHLMRRIACESDFHQQSPSDHVIVDIYNDGLGKGLLKDPSVDKPYPAGDVAKLGYGVDKYILLRVGPFPDLYERIALQHASRGDEASALIAAESANGKFTGFGSPFRFYARLLSSLPNRVEETRDAARMSLRLPLPSLGLSTEDFKEVAVLAQLADEHDDATVAIGKLREMYEMIRQHEQEEDSNSNAGKTPEQMAIDDANYLLDTAALTGGKWSDIRPKLADIYRSAGRNDMADFVSARY